MGAFTDSAKEFLANGMTLDEYKADLIKNVKVASQAQMAQLAAVILRMQHEGRNLG